MNYTPHNFDNIKVKANKVHEVFELTNDNLKNLFEDVYPKILYFTASWCGPCKKISPVFKDLAEINSGINFFKIDVDENTNLASNFKVNSMPTFICFKSKTDHKSFTGADTNKLQQYINWLNS